MDEEELQQALTAAVTCTILAAAGPQRSRVLATLYKVVIGCYIFHADVPLSYFGYFGFFISY